MRADNALAARALLSSSVPIIMGTDASAGAASAGAKRGPKRPGRRPGRGLVSFLSLGLDWSTGTEEDDDAVEAEEAEAEAEAEMEAEASVVTKSSLSRAWRGRRVHTAPIPNALHTPSVAHLLMGDIDRSNGNASTHAHAHGHDPSAHAHAHAHDHDHDHGHAHGHAQVVSVPAALALDPQSDEMLAIIGAHRTITSVAKGDTRVRLNGR